MAQALLTPGTPKKPTPDAPINPIAAQHPFPTTESATSPTVTAPPSSVPPPGAPQIGDALSYTAELKDPDELSGDAAKPVNVTTTRNAPAQTSSVASRGSLAAAPVPPPPAAPVVTPKRPEQPQVNDLAHIIGRAFKKLFGR
jgi:hypothetical protein